MNAKKFKHCILALSSLWAISVQGQIKLPNPLDDPFFTLPNALGNEAQFSANPQFLGCLPPYSDQSLVDFKAPLSLSVAVHVALCHNPQLRYSWAAIKVQAGALGEAKASYLPTLNGTMSQLKNHTQDLTGISPDASNAGKTKYLTLTWRLFDFGARDANVESTTQMLKAALASHDATLQKLLSTTVGAYFDALTAQSAYTSRKQAVELAQLTWEATQRRATRGAAALRSDTVQAEVALAKAKLTMNRAQGDLHKALSVLTYAMGLPAGTTIVVPDDMEFASEERMADLTQWLNEAQIKHPALLAARAQLASARANVKVASASGLPTLDYNLNFYENGYPNQGLNSLGTRVKTFGVVLTIPFFNGFATVYKVRGALAQEEQSLAQLEDTEQQILMGIVKAHADALSAFTNLKDSERLLESAQAAVESSTKRYKNGAADILELMLTQNALTDAQQERVRCLSEWRASRLKLLASSGLLGLSSIP
jgi:outer membrane protein